MRLLQVVLSYIFIQIFSVYCEEQKNDIDTNALMTQIYLDQGQKAFIKNSQSTLTLLETQYNNINGWLESLNALNFDNLKKQNTNREIDECDYLILREESVDMNPLFECTKINAEKNETKIAEAISNYNNIVSNINDLRDKTCNFDAVEKVAICRREIAQQFYKIDKNEVQNVLQDILDSITIISHNIDEEKRCTNTFMAQLGTNHNKLADCLQKKLKKV